MEQFGTAMLNAKAIGQVQTIDSIIELDYGWLQGDKE